MRKKVVVLLLGAAMCLAAAACGGTNADKSKTDDTAKTEQSDDASADEQNEGDKSGDNDKESEKEDSEEEKKEEAEEPEEKKEEETIYNIGDTATLGTWEISVTNMQIVETVEGEYSYFTPKEEGNKFVQVFLTANNVGKQAERFLPMVGMRSDISSKVVFGDGYEFVSTNLIGYTNDIHDSTVNPLSSVTGELVFEVPETVSASEDELQLHFEAGKDTLKFKIR